jgi:glycosyltransferase involved in cell wall biosynthesis
MPAASNADGTVVVDCAALQSPTSRGRGIGRYAREWAVALEAVAPRLVSAYLLDPDLPPPGELEELLATGKIIYRGAVALPERARVLHCLSPLDLAIGFETLWPAEASRRDLRRSATVYDLIPAKDPQTHLSDLVVRARYQVRLEALRNADQLHAISDGVAADLRTILAVPAERVVVAGCAPSAGFAPLSHGELDAHGEAASLAAIGIRGRFVLYPTGSHPRKNNEGLLAAWARLPEKLRRAVQLVLTGDLPAPMANHLRHLAVEGGFGDGIVLPGVVDDATLLSLYRHAELVCFPSLAEGYGLPVAEALACRTPVIGSDRAPLDELLPAVARFEPTDPNAIAHALESALADDGARASLLAASATPSSFEQVARRSAAALASLATSSVSRRTRRRRLAVVSPFPPAESGIARYTTRLVEALGGLGDFEIDCFTDGPTSDQRTPEVAANTYPASRFEQVAPLRGGYDEVIFTLGNSHHHLGALRALRRRPGVVIAHDVRLTNLYRFEAAQPDGPAGGFLATVRALYEDASGNLQAHNAIDAVDLERYDLLMAREAIALSRRYLVTSASAVALARIDARPADTGKIAALTFAFASKEPQGADRPSRGDAQDATEAPLIAHFGIVDPTKEPFTLLGAFAVLHAELPKARLAFVGPVSDSLCDELRRRAEAAGVGHAVEIAGIVSDEQYASALSSATVAVQLRATTNGEASAAIGDCLAAGIPTIVTGIGWARELPDEAVVRVAPRISPAALARVLLELLRDKDRRARLSAAAWHETCRRSFHAAACQLVELAELVPGRPRSA